MPLKAVSPRFTRLFFAILMSTAVALASAQSPTQTVANGTTTDPDDQGIWTSVTNVLGNVIGTVASYFSGPTLAPTNVANPTASVAGYKETDLNLANGPATNPFTVILRLDPTKGSTSTSNPLTSVFTINDGQNGDTDIAFALLRDYNGYWYTAKRVDGALTDPLVTYVNRLWDPRSPCAAANSCTYDTIYVTFLSSGIILLDEYATLSNPAAGTSKYSWYEGSVNSGYPILSYPTSGGLSTAPAGALNFAPARGIYLGGISKNWFQTAGPAAFDDPNLNSIDATTASVLSVRATNGGIFAGSGNDNLFGLHLAIQSDQKIQQGISSDATFTNGTLPCNTGVFQVDTSGNTQSTSFSPLYAKTPCALPGTSSTFATTAPLGQISPSHFAFTAANATETFTISNVSNTSASLAPGLIQIEQITANSAVNNTSSFQLVNSGSTCVAGSTTLAASTSCTVTVLSDVKQIFRSTTIKIPDSRLNFFLSLSQLPLLLAGT